MHRGAQVLILHLVFECSIVYYGIEILFRQVRLSAGFSRLKSIWMLIIIFSCRMVIVGIASAAPDLNYGFLPVSRFDYW
jgi:hypothetical protein